MSNARATPAPKLIAETFMSTVKIFTIILIVIIVLNNLVWAFYAFKPIPQRIGDAHIEINQSGNRDIKQEIKP